MQVVRKPTPEDTYIVALHFVRKCSVLTELHIVADPDEEWEEATQDDQVSSLLDDSADRDEVSNIGVCRQMFALHRACVHNSYPTHLASVLTSHALCDTYSVTTCTRTHAPSPCFSPKKVQVQYHERCTIK